MNHILILINLSKKTSKSGVYPSYLARGDKANKYPGLELIREAFYVATEMFQHNQRDISAALSRQKKRHENKRNAGKSLRLRGGGHRT